MYYKSGVFSLHYSRPVKLKFRKRGEPRVCVTVRERSTKTRPSSVSGFQPRGLVASLPAKRIVNVNGSLLYFYSICLDIRRMLNSILLTHHAYSITHFHSFLFLLERETEYFLSRYMRDVSFVLSGCFFRVLYLVRDQSKMLHCSFN